MMKTYNDYLLHYGVKGMKWGIRHDRNKSSTNTAISSKKLKLTTKQKKVLKKVAIGAAVVGGLGLASVAAYNVSTNLTITTKGHNAAVEALKRANKKSSSIPGVFSERINPKSVEARYKRESRQMASVFNPQASLHEKKVQSRYKTQRFKTAKAAGFKSDYNRIKQFKNANTARELANLKRSESPISSKKLHPLYGTNEMGEFADGTKFFKETTFANRPTYKTKVKRRKY